MSYATPLTLDLGILCLAPTHVKMPMPNRALHWHGANLWHAAQPGGALIDHTALRMAVDAHQSESGALVFKRKAAMAKLKFDSDDEDGVFVARFASSRIVGAKSTSSGGGGGGGGESSSQRSGGGGGNKRERQHGEELGVTPGGPST